MFDFERSRRKAGASDVVLCVAFLAASLLSAGNAAAQDCTDLKAEARVQLRAYLRVQHDYLLARKSVEIIEQWRIDYEDDALMNAKLTKARGLMDQLALESEQAKNYYHSALYAAQEACSDG